MAQVSGAAGVSPPQTRARVAWIFCSKREINSPLAATSACSASISATMACCVARGGRGILNFLADGEDDGLSDFAADGIAEGVFQEGLAE